MTHAEAGRLGGLARGKNRSTGGKLPAGKAAAFGRTKGLPSTRLAARETDRAFSRRGLKDAISNSARARGQLGTLPTGYVNGAQRAFGKSKGAYKAKLARSKRA